MSKQAINFIALCSGQSEANIRRAINMLSASVREEVISHYGGDIDTAIAHIHLGSK